MTETLLPVVALAVGLLVGWFAGTRSSRRELAFLERVRDGQAQERARLDRERARHRHLLVARTPDEAAAMEGREAVADRPPPPPPPAWTKDPRVQGYATKLVERDGRPMLQLITGTPGNLSIVRTIPIDPDGRLHRDPVTITPHSPATS